VNRRYAKDVRCAAMFLLVLLAACRTAAPVASTVVVAGPVAPAMPRVESHRDKERARCPVVGSCVPLYVFDEVVSASSVRRAITWMRSQREAGAQALVIKIDTAGGEVDAGFKLINAIESLGIATYCVVDDKAYSMGFAILQACTVRLATQHARLMIHEARLGVVDPEGQPSEVLTAVPADDERNLGVQAVSRVMAQHCAARMKISLAEYLQKTAGDWWMNGRDALAFGALDQVTFSVESVHRYVQAGLPLQ
jgi:ATP-dependent protease ClpP protease subunit